jgi:hypothetical protein
MRINSGSSLRGNVLIFILCVVAIGLDYLLASVKDGLLVRYALAIPGFIGIVILFYRGPTVFKYDTDGEVMNLTNEDPLLTIFYPGFKRHYEFPKRKLKGFKIKRHFLRRKLVIYIDSKNGRVKVRKLFVSYLNDSDFKNLRSSLNKYSSDNNNGRRRKSKSRRRTESSES